MTSPMTRRRRVAQLVMVATVGLLAVLVPALPASAHASFVRATPNPGSGLVQAPGEVVIRFTEPLVRELSKIEVVDRDGNDVTRGPTMPVEGDPQAMRRPLGLLSPGGYEVRWTTVSPLDGHTLKGRYTFAIGTVATPVDTVEAGPIDSEGWLGLVGRFVALGGLTIWGGHAVVSNVAARAGVPRRRLRMIGRVAPLAVAVGTAASLGSSALVATGSLGAFETVAFASTSGRLRVGLVAVAALAATVAASRRWLQRVLVAGALLLEVGSGHAASSPVPPLATASFALHLAAVGVWVFAVVAAILASGHLRQTLAAFTPYAVSAAAVVGLTGVANAVIELEDLSDLTETGYGKALVAKSVGFVLIALFGLIHYTARKHPQIGLDVLRLQVRGEFVAVVYALVVATALVGFPNPPADAAAQQRASETDPLLAALEERDAVSVAVATRRFTVALTVLPPRPGPVDLRVQVLGTEAGDALRNGTVRATGPDGQTREALLTGCGFGCYAGSADLAGEGAWRFDVGFASNTGRVETSYEIPLPTPDGSDEFERMRRAMRSLASAKVDEELSDRTDGPVIVSHYTFEAPDRMRLDVEGGSAKIAIGGTGYDRSGYEDPWDTYGWPEPGFSWPKGFYDSFFAQSTAYRIVTTDTLDGVDTRVLAFAQPAFMTWYRVWVGVDDGLVRRLEMVAERHMMNQSYSAFDQPVTVKPPV